MEQTSEKTLKARALLDKETHYLEIKQTFCADCPVVDCEVKIALDEMRRVLGMEIPTDDKNSTGTAGRAA
jgi:hypothetical protein